jgi:hypothetical protein
MADNGVVEPSLAGKNVKGRPVAQLKATCCLRTSSDSVNCCHKSIRFAIIGKFVRVCFPPPATMPHLHISNANATPLEESYNALIAK